MEKVLSPYEKECMNTCILNIHAFKHEVYKAFEDE